MEESGREYTQDMDDTMERARPVCTKALKFKNSNQYQVFFCLEAPGRMAAYLNIMETFDPYVWLMIGATVVGLALLLLFISRVC